MLQKTDHHGETLTFRKLTSFVQKFGRKKAGAKRNEFRLSRQTNELKLNRGLSSRELPYSVTETEKTKYIHFLKYANHTPREESSSRF